MLRRLNALFAVLLSLLVFASIAPAQSKASTSIKAKTSWTAAEKANMAEHVRQEFVHAWNGYKQYAWGHDEVRPLSKQPHDWYGVSLLMTPVDGLDTMVLMGLNQQADEARKLIDTQLNFDQDIYVKNFEITIRLLGGLLSSYELTHDKRLLELADDLGARLLPAFNSPTGMPYVFVNLRTGAVRGTESNPAEIGTLVLEFGTLSKLTGKPVYFEKAKHALTELYKRQSPIGLVGASINVETGKWTDETASITGGIDSYYEYLLKCSILFGDKDCDRMWKSSIAAVNRYLADDHSGSLWYGQANIYTGKRVSTEYGALDAFFPAVLALSGDLSRARRLQESSYKMWELAGIEPEVIDYSTMTIKNPHYQLRPEIIESTYYLYYLTPGNDPHYLDMGRTFYESLVQYARTDIAYAALDNVTASPKQKRDSMESFFFAETLKYLYLLYASRDTLDLKKTVFNTEAHPLTRSWPTN